MTKSIPTIELWREEGPSRTAREWIDVMELGKLSNGHFRLRLTRVRETDHRLVDTTRSARREALYLGRPNRLASGMIGDLLWLHKIPHAKQSRPLSLPELVLALSNIANLDNYFASTAWIFLAAELRRRGVDWQQSTAEMLPHEGLRREMEGLTKTKYTSGLVVRTTVKKDGREPASRKPTARALENQAIREAVVRAVAVEQKKRPFSIAGRGHEPRVTLDGSLAGVLRHVQIPAHYTSGFGANSHYPARVFETARQILRKRLRWSPIAVRVDGTTGQAWRSEKP